MIIGPEQDVVPNILAKNVNGIEVKHWWGVVF